MAEGAAGAVRVCPKCGLQNPGSNKFCGNCGASLPSLPDAAPSVDTEAAPPVAASAPTAAEAVPPSVVSPAPATTVEPPKQAEPAEVVPPIEIPQDPMKRLRERERLLTLANVQRLRGQFSEAGITLAQALMLAEGMADKDIAPLHELRGDIYGSQGKWDAARDAYNEAHKLDPARVSAEKKFAQMTLRIADEEALQKMGISGGAPLEAGAFGGGARGKRSPGLAMLLSLFVPGFGQLYNGDLQKGLTCLAVFVLALVIVSFVPGNEVLADNIRAFFNPRLPRGRDLGPFIPLGLLAMFAVWLYAVVDAAVSAAKTVANSVAGPKIDKSGWEV